MCHLVPGPLPCPEVVAVSYIRPAEVPTLFSVEGDAQVEQQNTVVGFLTVRIGVATSHDLSRERHKYAYRVVRILIAWEISKIAQIYCLSSYHHQLKSHWLDGKQNQRMDHLIYALVSNMLPHYVARCDSQDLGLKGPNLAKKQCKENRLQAVEMNTEHIHNLGGDRFHVESAMDSTQRYLVDLGNKSCDCPDWPRVRLCKHVSAVEHHFGNNDQQMGAMEDSLPKMPLPKQETLLDCHSTAGSTTTSILQNVILVSKGALDNGVPSSTETIRSLQAVEAHLMAVVRSTRSTESPVPDKEEVPPNQCSSMWAEAAKQMGVTQGQKRSQDSTEAPEPPATAQIENLNHKQARIKFTDLYSRGVSSGRAAAPDAQSAAQNAEMCARGSGSHCPPSHCRASHSRPTPSHPLCIPTLAILLLPLTLVIT